MHGVQRSITAGIIEIKNGNKGRYYKKEKDGKLIF